MVEWLCVRCFSCRAFQGQQKKKVKKFTCKMCREKQSVIKVYGISDKAKDIRQMVMRLNMSRATEDAEENENFDQGDNSGDPHEECDPYNEYGFGEGHPYGPNGEYLSSQEGPEPFGGHGRPQSQSKWSSFVATQQQESTFLDPLASSSGNYENSAEYVLEAPASSRPRVRNNRTPSSRSSATASNSRIQTSTFSSTPTQNKRPFYSDDGAHSPSSSRTNSRSKSSAFLPSASKKRKTYSSTAAGAKRGSFVTRPHQHSAQVPSRLHSLLSSSSSFQREKKQSRESTYIGKAHLSALSRAASETSAFFGKKKPPGSEDSFENPFDDYSPKDTSETSSNVFDHNFASADASLEDENAFVMELPAETFAKTNSVFGPSNIGAFDAFQRETRAFVSATAPGSTDGSENRACAGKWGKYL